MQHSNRRSYRFGIFHQALAVVLVPFILGTILLFWLHSLWSASTKTLNAEKTTWLLVSVLSETFATWSTASANLMAGTFVPENQAQASQYTSSLKKWYGYLENLVNQDNATSMKNLRKLEAIASEETRLLKSLPSVSSSSAIDVQALGQVPKVLVQIYKMRTEVLNLLNAEWKNLRQLRKSGDEARTRFRQVLYGCCVGNAVLASTLVFLFAGSITSRLRILMANANDLPRLQDFSNHVNGSDELSYLDTVLQGAANSLKAAAEHRQSIIGMVAHDMRSPLMAAQVSLQIIEEKAGEFSDEAGKALDQAFDNLASILQYVQELLTFQKTDAETVPGADGQANSANLPAFQDQPRAGSLLPAIRDCLFKPRVLRQILLLVAIPFSLQTGLLLWINQEINRCEETTVRSRCLSDNMMNGEFMQINMIRGSIAEAIYVFSSKEKFRQLAAKIFHEMEEQFRSIEAAQKNDPESLTLIGKSHKVFDEQVAEVMKVKPTDSPADIMKVFEKVSEVNTRSPEAWKVRHEAAIHRIRENVRLQQVEDQRTDSAAMISDLINWGLLSDAVLVVGLLLVFNLSIRRRMNILIENASSLGSRAPLKNVVEGQDEFAFLDMILHKAESQINEASTQRAQMMLSLANEISSPLREAQKNLRQFLQEKVLPDNCLNYMNKSQRNIERVLALTENLLTMESLSTGRVHLELKTCDINKVTDESLASVASLAQKKNIELLNEAASITVTADYEKLVQVLVNLLGNAIKFSPERTCVRVSCVEDRDSLRFAVSDQGPGMDEPTRQNVFEKFYQAPTAQKAQGFGLGLAICKLIVESHGGQIGVDSTPGSGTTFWFRLPRHTSLATAEGSSTPVNTSRIKF